VDTGIHAFGWSKEKAEAFILDNTTSGRKSTEEQACFLGPMFNNFA
jgi:uncharacterized protein (DUF885 family)